MQIYSGLGDGNLLLFANTWVILEGEWLAWWFRIASGEIKEMVFIELSKLSLNTNNFIVGNGNNKSKTDFYWFYLCLSKVITKIKSRVIHFDLFIKLRFN